MSPNYILENSKYCKALCTKTYLFLYGVLCKNIKSFAYISSNLGPVDNIQIHWLSLMIVFISLQKMWHAALLVLFRWFNMRVHLKLMDQVLSHPPIVWSHTRFNRMFSSFLFINNSLDFTYWAWWHYLHVTSNNNFSRWICLN